MERGKRKGCADIEKQIARVGFCSMEAEEELLKLMSSAELSVEVLCSHWAQSHAGVNESHKGTHRIFVVFFDLLPSFLSISIVSFCHLCSGTISDVLRSSKSNTSDLVKALSLPVSAQSWLF